MEAGNYAPSALSLSATEREKVYHRLIYEAPYVSGDEEKPCSMSQISWLNPSLVSKGQRFIRRNFFAVICAHLGALLYGFSFKRLSTVLLRTGKSHAVNDSMVRYLSTFIHFKNWYESDTLEDAHPGSGNNNMREIYKTMRDIQKVRGMHRYALKKCLQTPLPPNEDFLITTEKLEVIQALTQDLHHITTTPVPPEVLTYYPKVTMSQFDMAMTQFGLVGLIFLFPVTLGVRDLEGLEGFLHLWAVFGRLLGIQDRFNVALYPDFELYTRLFRNIGLASLKDSDIRIFTLQKALLDGFGKFTYFGSVKSFLFYGLCSKEALPEFVGNNLYKLLSWKDWCYYVIFKCILSLYYKFSYFHDGVDIVAKYVVHLHAKIYLPKQGRRKPQSREKYSGRP